MTNLLTLPFFDDPRNVILGVAGCAAPFLTVGEEFLPGLFLKPLTQRCLGQFIDGLALSRRLELQFRQQFVRYVNVDRSHGCALFQQYRIA